MRRLSSRIGKGKAVTATARKVAVLFYNAVRHGMEYVDPGSLVLRDTATAHAVVNNLHRRAKAFGFVLQPLEGKSSCRRFLGIIFQRVAKAHRSLACRDFTSIAGCAVAVPFGLKISAAPVSSCAFHVVGSDWGERRIAQPMAQRVFDRL